MNFSFRRTDRDGIKHPISKKTNINEPNIRNKIYSLKSLSTKSITMFCLVLLITTPVFSLSTFATIATPAILTTMVAATQFSTLQPCPRMPF